MTLRPPALARIKCPPDAPCGLYESLLTQALADLLQQIPADTRTIEPLRAADAADRLGLHNGQAVRTALEDLNETDRVNRGVEVANQLRRVAAVDLLPQSTRSAA